MGKARRGGVANGKLKFMKNTGFAIERVEKRVPTDFISFDGETYDWEQFHATAKRLKEVGDKAIPTERLSPEWVKEWEDKGVIEHYLESRLDDYGVRESWYMIKPGARHKEFMTAWSAFEKVRRTELDKMMKESRRAKLLRDLADLDNETPRRRTFEEIYEAATTVG